jgi:ribose 5-phosphate isomerase B
MSIVANRFAGVRATLCHDLYTARMSREHNDANVLCLGQRVWFWPGERCRTIIPGDAFSQGENHRRRLGQIGEYEQRNHEAE